MLREAERFDNVLDKALGGGAKHELRLRGT